MSMHPPSSPPLPLPPPDLARHHPAGWYPDPFDPAGWRWWNGAAWTAHAHKPGKKPFLPDFLSWPVVIAAPFALLAVLYMGYESPAAFLSTFVPALILLPTFWWLDRIEPEPLSSRIHAVLWGATVAVVIALVVNSFVAIVFGDTVAAVVSAPVVEEGAKVAGILWILRRKELDSVSDGIIYAGLIASGFALMEDVTYFAMADSYGALTGVLLLRGVLTPFAHPLFTMWAGLGIGWAVSRRKSIVLPALGGYSVSVTAHAMWNGTAVIAIGSGTDAGVLIGLSILLLFMVLFFSVAIAVVLMRRSERVAFDKAAPYLVQQFQLSPVEQGWLHSYANAISTRGTLPRRARRSFDGLRAALARLAAVHARGGDRELEQVYASQVIEARAKLTEQLVGGSQQQSGGST